MPQPSRPKILIPQWRVSDRKKGVVPRYRSSARKFHFEGASGWILRGQRVLKCRGSRRACGSNLASFQEARMTQSRDEEALGSLQPNGVCWDGRGASGGLGPAAGSHRSDPPSRRPAGYGRHIGNSGGCCAAALPQVSASKSHSGDKLQKPRRVPYYCSWASPKCHVTSRDRRLTPLKLSSGLCHSRAGEPSSRVRGIMSEICSMTHSAPICHHNLPSGDRFS